MKAPIPKARVIFASAERDTGETLSLSDKIGETAALAETTRNVPTFRRYFSTWVGSTRSLGL